MSQPKKIPDSEIIQIIKQIKNKEISLRKKAKELDVSPSSLHECIKKFKNQKTIFDNSFLNYNENPEQKPRKEVKNPEVKIKPKKKKKDIIQNKHESITKTRRIPNRQKDKEILSLRKERIYIPIEVLSSFYWILTTETIRCTRKELIDKIIKLLKIQKKAGIERPRGKNDKYNM